MTYEPIPPTREMPVPVPSLQGSLAYTAMAVVCYAAQFAPNSQKEPEMRETAEASAIVFSAIAAYQLVKRRFSRNSTLDDRVGESSRTS